MTMPPTTPTEQTSDDYYLKMLEKVKEQYQQYVEVSRLYELPGVKEEDEVVQRLSSPSPEHPLTTNTFRVRQDG